MKVINYIVLIISIIGCVNWGLIGLFDFNLVDMLFGTGSILSRAVYLETVKKPINPRIRKNATNLI